MGLELYSVDETDHSLHHSLENPRPIIYPPQPPPSKMKNNQATPLSTSPPSLFPPDTYIYSILPLATDADAAAAAPTALATISSDDTIRLFDCATLQPFLLFSAVQRHEGVTCLRGNGPWCVLTAGRDGVVRGWDLRVGMVYEIRDESKFGRGFIIFNF